MTKKITIPELSLIILVGASGSGKSSFAKKHFKPTEIISSDYCRGLVSDDENNQECTKAAFEVLHFIIAKRLEAGKLTVIDATNVQSESRKNLIALAKRYHVLPIAVVLDMPIDLCLERNKKRLDRNFGRNVIWNQYNNLRRSLKNLKKKEGINQTYLLKSEEETNQIQIERVPTWTNKKHEKGKFDIIGDIHGCFDELKTLLEKLNYTIEKQDNYVISHPDSRRLIFVGDLVDRGFNSPEVLRLVMDAVHSGIAFCVNGNHDDKLKRKLQGRKVTIAHGLQETLDQLEQESEEFKASVLKFLDSLISHYVFDDGKLAVTHAGIKEKYLARASAKIREFCMYGETTGEIDKFGLPVRYPWAKEYRGETLIVYGHTPVPKAEWVNNTINIDTGCVFGGKLTALRYPEKELVSVDAAKTYYEPVRPLDYQLTHKLEDNLLDIEDVAGKRIISTQLHNNIIIREENTIPALEIMSRFAIDPRWLIYLPPTMSPTEISDKEGLLEHPKEVFSYYSKKGVKQLICQEKHMGSRAIIVICRNNKFARKHFGISGNEIGSCYTRTGRSFFPKTEVENEILEKISKVITKAKLWDKLNTDWICFDTEIMPWSAKAKSLIEQQYAAVGAAAEIAMDDTLDILSKTKERSIDGIDNLYTEFIQRSKMVQSYRNSYRRYCSEVNSIADYKIAPFHILAHENSLNMNKDHLWHLNMINLLCEIDPNLFCKTSHKIVNPEDEIDCKEVIDWWQNITSKGSEGIVIKPMEFTLKNNTGLVQPAIKCRGKDYLRIIYGAEYTAPQNLERLKVRNLKHKRSLALREYALGYEALFKFVNKSPLYKVHEAVFGILAIETEPVDPRL